MTHIILIGKVTAGRMHIGDKILCLLLDLELIVCDYHERIDHLREVIVAEAHVFDGQTLAQLQYQLLVPVDEVVELVIGLQWKHLSLDVDLDGSAINVEFESEQDGFVLEFKIENWNFMEALV